MNIDKGVLAKAASELRRDVGNLRDFPADLRNTIASLYYEHWWFQLSQEPSNGHASWTSDVVTRMGHYELVPALVKSMREIRRESEAMFEMTLGTTRDLLRYNLKDVTRKSAARRAVEKRFRKPYFEVPGIYDLAERAFADAKAMQSSGTQKPESADQSSTVPDGGHCEPDLKFISELPHPQHNRVEKAFRFQQFVVKYYRNPKSFGEIVAGIPPIYNYPQVAVVELRNDPILVIRTEQGVGGETYLCSCTKDGHRGNFGKCPETDAESFLQRVVEIVPRFGRKAEGEP